VSKHSLGTKLSHFLWYSSLILIAGGCAQSQQPISLSPPRAAIGTGQTVQFTTVGDPSGVTWSVVGLAGAGAGTISSTGNYTAPSGSQSMIVTVTAASKSDPTRFASAVVNIVAPGQFTATQNVQVAQYTVSPPAPASVSVQFGLDTTYGLTTWSVPTAIAGPLSLYVAGMKASTPYHMRGVVQFADGTQFVDSDQVFTTGALPAGVVPNLTVTTTAGMTPQSGVELLDLANSSPGPSMAVATDVNGNVLWTYTPVLAAGVEPQPIKLMPNGHFMMGFGNGAVEDGLDSMLQEVDLAGNVIWQMTAAQLNAALATATCAECDVTVIGTHHDLIFLPTGHLIVIASTHQTLSDGTTATGDVIIDLDPNHNPVWAWNEFNHLDTNRRPYLYPDWTHTNALLYSVDDGDLIISMRHQNWLIKIDYNNGAGSGDILWHLGYQGDFMLLNADGSPDTNATDWFFAQHGPSFASANSTGNFTLALFDNGDDRGVAVAQGGTCGVSGQPACYSTAQILQIDETSKTATISFNPVTPNYSYFGGNVEVLKNGDVEYDEASSEPFPPNFDASVFEVTQTGTPQTVWQMTITGQFAYRAMRIPSLYPGVQW
jgi:arylsulfate sulfotransferase